MGFFKPELSLKYKINIRKEFGNAELYIRLLTIPANKQVLLTSTFFIKISSII
jgi:hypothetical protein